MTQPSPGSFMPLYEYWTGSPLHKIGYGSGIISAESAELEARIDTITGLRAAVMP
jgi:hypothetical protein